MKPMKSHIFFLCKKHKQGSHISRKQPRNNEDWNLNTVSLKVYNFDTLVKQLHTKMNCNQLKFYNLAIKKVQLADKIELTQKERKKLVFHYLLPS
jgi:hypothetical protein